MTSVVQESIAAKRKISISDANHFTAWMQTKASQLVNVLAIGCATPMFDGNSTSVRGYGLRTYESRQGRNAATVV